MSDHGPKTWIQVKHRTKKINKLRHLPSYTGGYVRQSVYSEAGKSLL